MLLFSFILYFAFFTYIWTLPFLKFSFLVLDTSEPASRYSDCCIHGGSVMIWGLCSWIWDPWYVDRRLWPVMWMYSNRQTCTVHYVQHYTSVLSEHRTEHLQYRFNKGRCTSFRMWKRHAAGSWLSELHLKGPTDELFVSFLSTYELRFQFTTITRAKMLNVQDDPIWCVAFNCCYPVSGLFFSLHGVFVFFWRIRSLSLFVSPTGQWEHTLGSTLSGQRKWNSINS